jgi:sterol desaturase/sphingolipid hydroxylase (fatty acid hydroxylase superfamily)
MDGAATAERDKSGEWRPPEAIETPAVFVWPPDPAGILKWLFGYNGYLWPWNIIYVAMAIATWRWLTPELSSMTNLEPGWILLILLRNAAIVLAVVGAWHWRLYIRRAQGTDFKYNGRWQATDSPNFMFRDQVRDNLFRTFASAVPAWTGYEVITLWGQANGWFPMVNWRDHPIYCGLFMLLIPLILEVHFYLIHRLIHWPPLYRAVHYIHHKNANPGPWSGLAMHPVEHLLYFSSALIHWIIPSHPLHVIFNLQFLAVYPAQDHSGFNRVALTKGFSVPTGDSMHYLHHRLFEVNYGSTGTIPIDQWLGTLHDGSAEADAAFRRRLRERRVPAA